MPLSTSFHRRLYAGGSIFIGVFLLTVPVQALEPAPPGETAPPLQKPVTQTQTVPSAPPPQQQSTVPSGTLSAASAAAVSAAAGPIAGTVAGAAVEAGTQAPPAPEETPESSQSYKINPDGTVEHMPESLSEPVEAPAAETQSDPVEDPSEWGDPLRSDSHLKGSDEPLDAPAPVPSAESLLAGLLNLFPPEWHAAASAALAKKISEGTPLSDEEKTLIRLIDQIVKGQSDGTLNQEAADLWKIFIAIIGATEQYGEIVQ